MTPPDPAPRRFLPALLLLFVASGCAAMIYEVVWLQLLQLVIGATATSLGVLLGTFMGGMCLGSLLLPRLVGPRRHPLRVYAILELGIGALGLALLFGIPALEEAYSRHAVAGPAGILLRGALAALCLLPPTILMGATLPTLARWVEAGPGGVPTLGVFYGGNIAGAVVGCLLAGFYLLRVFDMATATYVAAALNLVVAVAALILSALSLHRPAEPAVEDEPGVAGPAVGAGGVYLAIALSGAAALGAEVTWTRLLALLLGGTVYTFALILAVFLAGLGIGSGLGASWSRRAGSARVALGICQLGLTAAIAWSALVIARSLPYWPIQPALAKDPWTLFQLDLVRCVWALLPPAILWGASFPLALAAAAGPGQDPGRLVGRVYAANTLGAIVGALAFSLWLVPAVGTVDAQRVLIGLAAAGALAALVPPLLSARGVVRVAGAVALLAALAGAGWLGRGVAPLPWAVVAFGRQSAVLLARSDTPVTPELPAGADRPEVACTFVGEGANVTVAVTETAQGVRSFHGAGKIQASTLPTDMRLQRMLGHLPALLHAKPESVLVVACGAGVTAGSFIPHPDVRRVVICDIEPMVPTQVTPRFGKENYHVVDGIAEQNPHTSTASRSRWCTTTAGTSSGPTREKFDVITSDPIDPWVKGCAALNTVEYYRMCRDHLNPGGSVSLWFPIANGDLETARSLIATFFEVFPEGSSGPTSTKGSATTPSCSGRSSRPSSTSTPSGPGSRGPTTPASRSRSARSGSGCRPASRATSRTRGSTSSPATPGRPRS